MIKGFLAVCLAVLIGSPAGAVPLPVIDMHMHALAADQQGPPPMGTVHTAERVPRLGAARTLCRAPRRRGKVMAAFCTSAAQLSAPLKSGEISTLVLLR